MTRKTFDSAEASREIRSLIRASVETVGESSAPVDAANADIACIINQVRHVDQLVAEIQSSCNDQYSSISMMLPGHFDA